MRKNIVNKDSNLFEALSIEMNTIETLDKTKHWHEDLEIDLIIDGEGEFKINNKVNYLKKDDIILINPNIIHEINSTAIEMITVKIRLDLLTNIPKEIKETHFSLNSSRYQKDYFNIKSIIAKMVKYNLNEGRYVELMNASLTYNLIYDLFATCNGGKIENHSNDENLIRINSILNKVAENYTNPDLSLNNISKEIYVTPQYLSKIFKIIMNKSFHQYLTEYRLIQSNYLLNNSNKNLKEIALEVGFPNSRAFTSSYISKYGVSPLSIKKNRETDITIERNSSVEKINYLINFEETFQKKVSDFLETYTNTSFISTIKNEAANEEIEIPSNKSSKITFMKHFIGVNHVKAILESEIQKELIEVQNKIHFDYIKMHGIFDDRLFVYSEDKNGNPIYNFNLIDQAYDFIISLKLKPLVQLSFMPKALAKNPNRKTFESEFIMSMPKDITKWNNLCAALVNHFILRYGIAEVSTWLFSCWNEPNKENHLFGFEKDEDYFCLYKNTYETIKKINKDLRFGGPAFLVCYGKDFNFLKQFLKFTIQNEITPDFITIHYYDIELSEEFFLTPDSKNKLWLAKEGDNLKNSLIKIKELVKNLNLSDKPIYVTEWNSTTSHSDLLSDTCFKSCYIVKNILSAQPYLDGICYWLLNDMNDEVFLPNTIFHGGLGLYTYNGIKKPSFYAFSFLHELAGKWITSGKNYLLTEKDSSYYLIIYNYSHFSNRYAREIGTNTSYLDRYNVFPDAKTIYSSIRLDFLSGEFLITEKELNRNHGSAFDNFVALGGNEVIAEDELEYLKNISQPLIKKYKLSSTPTLNINVKLEPHEVKLLKIEKIG